MKKNTHKKPESFIRHPSFPGGKKAFDEFVKSELKYPEEALKNKIEGNVSIEHDIDSDGNVIEVRLKHGIGYGCDEEALRIVKLLKYEKKRYRGLRVIFHNTINIFFRLNNSGIQPVQGQVINYSYKETKKVPEKNKPESKPAIVYHIKIN